MPAAPGERWTGAQGADRRWACYGGLGQRRQIGAFAFLAWACPRQRPVGCSGREPHQAPRSELFLAPSVGCRAPAGEDLNTTSGLTRGRCVEGGGLVSWSLAPDDGGTRPLRWRGWPLGAWRRVAVRRRRLSPGVLRLRRATPDREPRRGGRGGSRGSLGGDALGPSPGGGEGSGGRRVRVRRLCRGRLERSSSPARPSSPYRRHHT